jgi:hypothetical protein
MSKAQKQRFNLCPQMHAVILFQAAGTWTPQNFDFSLTFVAHLQGPQLHVVGGASDTLP